MCNYLNKSTRPILSQPSHTMIPLSSWARLKGVSYITAWKWWKKGKLPVHAEQMPSGMILVESPTSVRSGGTWIYARITTKGEEPSLELQDDRCRQFAAMHGWTIQGSVRECAASTEVRPKFWQLLSSKPERILIMDPSRFSRLEYEAWLGYLAQSGCELVCMGQEVSRNGTLEDCLHALRRLLQKHWGIKRRALLLDHLCKLADISTPI